MLRSHSPSQVPHLGSLAAITTMKALLTFVTVCLGLALAAGDDGLERGFGDQYQWHSMLNGTQLARREQRPIAYIIHKTWCGTCYHPLGPVGLLSRVHSHTSVFADACTLLKAQFNASAALAAASEAFVMVNLQDDEEPDDALWAPVRTSAQPSALRGRSAATARAPRRRRMATTFPASSSGTLERACARRA